MARGRPAADRAGGTRNSFLRGRLVCALCLLGPVGCGGTTGHTVKNDPLLGSSGGQAMPPASTSAAATATGSQTRPDPQIDLNQLPAPAPNLTAAALASGPDQTLDTAPKLQIPVGPTQTKPGGADPWRPATTTTLPRPTDIDTGPARGAATMTLQGPVPIPSDPKPPVGLAPVPFGPKPAVAEPDPVAQAIDSLKQRGGVVLGPEKQPNGEYHFLCQLPDRQQPGVFHRYEVSVAGDPINAVRAVMEEIQRDGK